MADNDILAGEIQRLQDTTSLAELLTSRYSEFSIEDAYHVSARLLEARRRRGWKVVGRKIGFTNRTIYEEYGVYEPIFGYMYDRTVTYLGDGPGPHLVSLYGLSQPRIEPEIVFKLHRSPPFTHDPAVLLGAIEWMAHGVELVQCHFPDWKFAVADTIADGGLHGIYLAGPPVPVPESIEERRRLVAELERFTAVLYQDGAQVAAGGGEVVLGSPLNALAHLIEVLASLPDHPPLAPGEIVTTGTLTAAMPVAAGETWSTHIEGLAVKDLSLRFE